MISRKTATSPAVYGTITGSPVVPEVLWMRTMSRSGAQEKASGAAFRNDAFVMNGRRRKSPLVRTSPEPSIPRCERQAAELAQRSSVFRIAPDGKERSSGSVRAAVVARFVSGCIRTVIQLTSKKIGAACRGPFVSRMAGYKKGREGGSPTSTAEKYARGGGSSAATTSGY